MYISGIKYCMASGTDGSKVSSIRKCLLLRGTKTNEIEIASLL